MNKRITQEEFEDLVSGLVEAINNSDDYSQMVEAWWNLVEVAEVQGAESAFGTKAYVIPYNRDLDYDKIWIDTLRFCALSELKKGDEFKFSNSAKNFLINELIKPCFENITLQEFQKKLKPALFEADLDEVYYRMMGDIGYNLFIPILGNKNKDVIEWVLENRKRLYFKDEEIKSGAQYQEDPELKELILKSVEVSS